MLQSFLLRWASPLWSPTGGAALPPRSLLWSESSAVLQLILVDYELTAIHEHSAITGVEVTPSGIIVSTGVPRVGTCSPYLGQCGSWDLHKFEEFFGGVGWGQQTPRAQRYTVYLLWTYHENAFVHCRLYTHIWLLGALPPDHHQGSALDLAGGLPSPGLSVPTLPTNPGYTNDISIKTIYILGGFTGSTAGRWWHHRGQVFL